MKSGTLPLFAGMAAQYGYLDLSLVILTVFCGGYLGDEFRFRLVRKYGDNFITKRPRLTKLAETAKRLLDRYGLIYMFIYRSPRGMRTIGALPVALTNMKWVKFTVLNAASAVLWTTVLVGVGYVFGRALENLVNEQWGMFSIVLLLVFLGPACLDWRAVKGDPKYS